jgi:hypothetical protein
MWAKADPSAGEMNEGTGAAGEECSGKARCRCALTHLLECLLHSRRKKNLAKAFNQQSHLLKVRNINLISTETCSEPAFKTGAGPRLTLKYQYHSWNIQQSPLSTLTLKAPQDRAHDPPTRIREMVLNSLRGR